MEARHGSRMRQKELDGTNLRWRKLVGPEWEGGREPDGSKLRRWEFDDLKVRRRDLAGYRLGRSEIDGSWLAGMEGAHRLQAGTKIAWRV